MPAEGWCRFRIGSNRIEIESPFMVGLLRLRHRLADEQRRLNLARIARVAAASSPLLLEGI